MIICGGSVCFVLLKEREREREERVVPTGKGYDAMATVCVKMKGKLRAMSTKMVET